MSVNKLKINSTNSPKGVFKFCAIIGKGILNENNTKEDVYEYKVTIEADLKDAQDLLDEIDDFIEDNAPRKGELTKVPYQTHDDYDGVPVGKVWIYAKATTEYPDKVTNEPIQREIRIYDTSGAKVKLPDNTGVGNGSKGKLFGTLDVWERGGKKAEYGATIWLTGIQITDFISYEFEETVVAEEGSFKGFNTSKLEEDEDKEERSTESRGSRRESRPDRARRARRE